MNPDPAVRAALQQRITILAPVSARLHAAHVHPPIAPHDWHGPAARAFADLEAELRGRITAADELVAALLRESRLALAGLEHE
ncbi:MAG TPA: hypothetical protein VNR36_11670 [Pseudolysinimonas sp.]|nr:hypothetical protein [Pseudolysinimonas sp.]